jgi:hypothetical protein
MKATDVLGDRRVVGSGARNQPLGQLTYNGGQNHINPLVPYLVFNTLGTIDRKTSLALT